MLIVLPTVLEPVHDRFSSPTTQEELAAGNRGAWVAAIAAVTVIPLTINGATFLQVQAVGQVVDPGSEQLPLSTTETLVEGEEAFQVIRIFGCAGCDAHTVLSTLNVAIHPLADVGADVIDTATPVCGFSTLKLNPEIDVVPGGILLDRLTVVFVLAVPAQTLFLDPRAHTEEAPGNKGATWPAIAVVTVIPLITVGALATQLQVAGQFVVPLALQFPVSFVDTLTEERFAVQYMLICGFASVVQIVRSTRKIATQLLLALGTCVRTTETPAWGLVTVNPNPLIEVVPGARSAAMLIELFRVPVPPHTRSSCPLTQMLDAPGYSSGSPDTSVLDTAIPLSVVGADCLQLHCVGQFAVPASEQLPVSLNDQDSVVFVLVQWKVTQ